MREPSGLYATEFTLSVCPCRGSRVRPVPASHTLNVLSELPETTRETSRLYATERTSPVWPVRVRRQGDGFPGRFSRRKCGPWHRRSASATLRARPPSSHCHAL